MHRIEPGQDRRDDRVPGLVVRDDAAHAWIHRPLLFQTGDYAVDGFLEIGAIDFFLVAPGREQSSLVDEVSQIGAGESGRAGRNDRQVHFFRQLYRHEHESAGLPRDP